MKMRIALSALFLLSLAGCATQAQVEQQTRQLEVISATLNQIQANQLASLEQQKAQTALQAQNNNLQAIERQAGSR